MPETLVHPFQLGNVDLAHQYREILFTSSNVTTVECSQEIAEEAARLRAFHTIRTLDAIQMATAVNFTASSFLTNDMRLPSLPGLQLLVLDELKARLSS